MLLLMELELFCHIHSQMGREANCFKVTACSRKEIFPIALAIVFGVKTFHDYLFGRRFTINHCNICLVRTNQSPHKPLPEYIQRWALKMTTQLCTSMVKTTRMLDSLSRLQLDEAPSNESTQADLVLLLTTLEHQHLVWRRLEYAAEVWNPNLERDINCIERVHSKDMFTSLPRLLWRFVTLPWPTNAQKQKNISLIMYVFSRLLRS